MNALKPTKIELIQGKTFTDVLRWELTSPIIYKPIASLLQVAPLRLEVTGHGLVNGWNAAITGVREIDTIANNIKSIDYHPVTVLDANNIEINGINAAAFRPYVSGGVIQYNTPKNLTGYGARMAVKAVQGEYTLLKCSAITTGITGTTKPTAAGVDGGVTWVSTTDVATKEWIAGATYSVNDVVDTKALMFLTVDNGRIIMDPALHTITRVISATDIAALTWSKGVFDLEAFSDDLVPVVTRLEYGPITVSTENTK